MIAPSTSGASSDVALVIDQPTEALLIEFMRESLDLSQRAHNAATKIPFATLLLNKVVKLCYYNAFACLVPNLSILQHNFRHLF